MINISNGITYSTKVFSGGEQHIQLNIDNAIEKDYQVSVVATDLTTSDLVTLGLILNALENEMSSLPHLVLPYFPYSRQDRVCAPGQANSLLCVAPFLLYSAGSLETWDMHSNMGIARLREYTNTISISSSSIISTCPELVELIKDESTILACPDKGAISRVMAVADKYNKPVIYFDKVRDPFNGNITGYEALSKEDLSGKTAVIIDDICDGGYTFILLAKQLIIQGAREIVLYITHGIFSKGVDILFNSGINKIYTTNSFQKQDPRVNTIHFLEQYLESTNCD